jgi:hypothetical protein
MSSSTRPSISLAVLNIYFDEVVPLERYLHEIIKPHSLDFSDSEIHSTLAEDNAYSCRYLLQTSYVGLQSDGSQRPSFAAIPPMMYMREVSLPACVALWFER